MFVLLVDHWDAMALIVTWPKIGNQYEEAANTEDEAQRTFKLSHVRDRWAAATGYQVDGTDIERLEPMLFDNGFIGPTGSVEPDVLKFIAAEIGDRADIEHEEA
jgi:hypothetical protein